MRRLFFRPFAKGVSMVEVTLVLPLLTLLLFSITEFGLHFSNWEIISDAAREGARNEALIKADQMKTEVEIALDAAIPLQTGEVDFVKDVRFLKPLIKVEAMSNPDAWKHTFSLLPEEIRVEAEPLLHIIYFTSQDAQRIINGETEGEDCSDMIDNDGDKKIDCRDEDCFNDPFCHL